MASNAKEFRYGFQNQEEDDEIKGEGNSLNFEFRMHDPRLGRFFAIDPLAKKYPFYSPYAFSGNQVIYTVELEGLEPDENLNVTELESVSIEGPFQGKSGDHLAWTDGGIIISFGGSRVQAVNFAELMNLSHSLRQGSFGRKRADKGYESTIVVSKDHELGLEIIASLKKNHNIDFNDLTRKQKKALLRIQWKEGEDRSDLFYYRPFRIKLSQVAIPIPTTMPVVIPSTGKGVGYGEGEVGVSLLNLSSDLADAFYAKFADKLSGKNEKHGDGGRAQTKSEEQIADLEGQLQNLSGREKKKVEQKIKNIKRAADKAKKGEEHSKANKR